MHMCVYMYMYTRIYDRHICDTYVDIYRYVDMIDMYVCICIYMIRVYIMYMCAYGIWYTHTCYLYILCVHTCTHAHIYYISVHVYMCMHIYTRVICLCVTCMCYMYTCVYKCVYILCVCAYRDICVLHAWYTRICMCANVYVIYGYHMCACVHHMYVCVLICVYVIVCTFISIYFIYRDIYIWKGKASCSPISTPPSRGKHYALADKVTHSSPHTSLPFILLRWDCITHSHLQPVLLIEYGKVGWHSSTACSLMAVQNSITQVLNNAWCLLLISWQKNKDGMRVEGIRLALTSPSNSSISPPSARMVTRFLHFTEG